MSTLKTNTLSNAAGSKSVPVDTVVDGSAKAWVNFNGTGTVTIRASFNVTSITDNGVGNYTVNFATALSDSFGSVVATPRLPSASGSTVAILSLDKNVSLSASSTTMVTYTSGGSAIDCDVMNVSVFR